MKSLCSLFSLMVVVFAFSSSKVRGAGAEPLTVAVLPLEASQQEERTVAAAATSVLYGALSQEEKLQLVERERLDEILREQAMTLSGLTPDERGIRVGQLVAAKIVVVGRVTRMGDQLLLSTRAIGTETSRLLADTETVTPAQVADGAQRLGARLLATLVKRGPDLVAPIDKQKDPIEDVRRKLQGKKLPRVAVAIPEQISGAPVADPAVETELLYTLQRCGFEVVDASKVKQEAAGHSDWWLHTGGLVDTVIVGEAILERGGTFGPLTSGRARVELKALDATTGKVLAIERTTKSATDVSPAAAAKNAAQQATQKLMRGFLLEMVTAWGKGR